MIKTHHLIISMAIGMVAGCNIQRDELPRDEINRGSFKLRHIALDDKIHAIWSYEPMDVLLIDTDTYVVDERLKQGTWLLIIYSFHSSQDIQVAQRSVGLANKIKDICKVAIQPVDGFDNISELLPKGHDNEESPETPLWILYKEGNPIELRRGNMSDEQVNNFVRLSKL